MTQLTALFIDPPPAQITLNTASTLPRFVAENHLDRLAVKSSRSLGSVILRWSRHDISDNSHRIYQQAYQALFETLQDAQAYQDLIFASNSHELGITFSRESAHHIHHLIRDLLQQVRFSKVKTPEQKERSICSILSLKVGWATSNAIIIGAEVIRLAEQRSHQSGHFL